MRVELLCTLKASETWGKGTVFDDAVSPIPKDIMLEVAQKAKTVRVLSEPRKAKPEPEPEKVGNDLESNNQKIINLTFAPEDEALGVNLDPHNLLKDAQIITDEGQPTRLELGSPEAATEKNVEAETDNESFLTKENPTKHLPELEGLIHAKGTIAAVSNLLNVTYMTISRWRKGKTPKPEMLEKIKKEYDKLMRLGNDQNRTDNVASAGIEGTYIKP